MTVLATPIRGLRMMTVAAALMMLRYLLELLLAVWWVTVDTPDGFASVLTWSARLHLLEMAALTLLAVGVASNLGELRRRQLSIVAGVIALATFAFTLAVHAWLYDLMIGLADAFAGRDRGSLLALLDELEKVPSRTTLSTIAYVGGLSATVVMIRGYAMTDGNLGLREQARAIGGMLILLLIADTFYRYTYGFGGGGMVFGIWGVAVAIALLAFWFWCHRRVGHLFDTARYYLRANAEMPIAAVVPAAIVRPKPPAAARPTAIPPIAARPTTVPPIARPVTAPPIAARPIEPLIAAPPPAAPARVEDAPSAEGGPRFLR